MGHTGMVSMIIMVLEAAMTIAIAHLTALPTAPTAGSTTVAYLATLMGKADTADGDGAFSSHTELALR